MLSVSYLTAAGAGALSFLSPCVLPLVPPYLCYMAGVSVEDFRAEKESRIAAAPSHRRSLAFAAICFVLGFTTVFVALGAELLLSAHSCVCGSRKSQWWRALSSS